jgi:hypothetical protein
MFTGLLPLDHRVEGNTQALDERFITIAEHLRNQGYATGAVVSLGVLRSKFGLQQGFDVYNDDFDTQWFRAATEITDTSLRVVDDFSATPFFLFVHYSDPHEPYAPPGLEYPRFKVLVNGETLAEAVADSYGLKLSLMLDPGVTRVVLEPIADDSGQRLVFRRLGVSHRKVSVTLGQGWPGREGTTARSKENCRLPATFVINNSSGARGRFDLRFFAHEVTDMAESRRRYALEVEYADREIGRLLRELEMRSVLEDTVIVLTSDHGEGLGEHNLMGHKEQLYDSLIRVPLIIVAPGQMAAGERSPVVARHVDLVPTLLDLLQVQTPPTLPMRGVSLRQLVDSTPNASTLPVIGMTFRPNAKRNLLAIVHSSFKLIRNTDTGKEELYNLSTDTGELQSLLSDTGTAAAVAHRDELSELLSSVLEARPQLPDVDTPNEVDLSDEEIEQLRMLGYLD